MELKKKLFIITAHGVFGNRVAMPRRLNTLPDIFLNATAKIASRKWKKKFERRGRNFEVWLCAAPDRQQPCFNPDIRDRVLVGESRWIKYELTGDQGYQKDWSAHSQNSLGMVAEQANRANRNAVMATKPVGVWSKDHVSTLKAARAMPKTGKGADTRLMMAVNNLGF